VGSGGLRPPPRARARDRSPPLNAVVTLDAARARRAADAADAAVTRKETLGPLHGVPMTIKDTYEIAGLRTTCGFTPWSEHVPDDDAEAARRLRDAGAGFMGKSNEPSL